VRDGLRAVVRQLSAAIYIFIAYGVVAYLLRAHPWAFYTEPLLVVLGAAVTARLIDGPWWTSALVGPFVAMLDATFLLFVREDGEPIGVRLATSIAVLTGSGLVGVFLGAWRRKGRATPAGA
jgi:hypothetical protein